MQQKKKLCNGPCNSLQYIWKNTAGKRYCKSCWSAHSARPRIKPTSVQKRIPARSPKRAKEEREYSAERIKFLNMHTMCEANMPGICTGTATDVHHTYAGSNRQQYFLQVDTWKALCRMCHTWVHNNPKAAKELGLLK